MRSQKNYMIRFFPYLLLLILVTVIFVIFITDKPHSAYSGEKAGTKITAVLNQPLNKGENLIFCSTFQMAWNEMMDLIQGPVQLEGAPPLATQLNERLLGKEELSSEDYLVMVGQGKDNISEKIQESLKSRFNYSPQLDLSVSHPNDYLIFAFLRKALQFEIAFESPKAPILFEKKYSVEGFGIYGENEQLISQVAVHDYEDEDNFIISLKSQVPNDQIILAKVPPDQTLQKTIEMVLKRIKKSRGQVEIKSGDQLLIPKIDIEATMSFNEIIGRRILNGNLEQYQIRRALQLIDFRLDETGAILESEANLYEYWGSKPKHNMFIFNKPFLLILKEKGARWPYFALWVENEEVMVPFHE